MALGLIFLLFLSVINSPLGLPQAACIEDNKHRELAVAVEIPGFISIDCGAAEDYIDQRHEIPYKSDKDFTVSGIEKQISSEFYGDLEMPYRSLRSFPEGKRNCYTLKPAAGKNNKYLIRASFVYGNYDGKSSVPTFDLYIGVNLWATTAWNNSHREVIYVPSTSSTDYIDVCLVKTAENVPFISTLELRQLDNYIYTTDQNDQVLKLSIRYDMGMRTWSKRYPQDVLDRMWEAFVCDNSPSSHMIETNTSITRSNDDFYKLPETMLRTACTTLNSSVPLNIKFTPRRGSSRFYFCFHFLEFEELEAGLVREMMIVLNGIHTISQSIKLEYLKPQTLCSNGFPVNLDQENTLSISSTSSSTLPPILNGLEIFYSIGTPNSPTLLQDIKAIMDIRQQYRVSKNWQGDPCKPLAFLWDGLNCSNDTPSRITSLNLSSSNLRGYISSSISTLTAMEYLDLSYNELKGPLPEFLALLPHLKVLNLTGNKLTGTIPEILLQKFKDGTLVLSLEGNPELLCSPQCNKKKELAIPILSSIIAALILVILFGIIVIYTRRAKSKENSIELKASFKLKNRQYSYFEVVSITYNFKVIIGEGGFGKVYLGVLEDQTMVAVKILSPSSQQGCKEFQAEAQLLMIVHHRNLVSLLGYCDEGDHKALIYEYMVNGNLQQHLSDTNTKPLSWIGRLRIAVDAAHGLEYLHNSCRLPIIHRDLKPANVLLDKEMQAKISDFGLSRTFSTGNESQIFTTLAGTPGYLDLENQKCGNFDKKSDIYSFGIILLELITGSPAITYCSGEKTHILDWVNSKIKTGDIEHIVDFKLQGDFNKNSAWKVLEIAISCTQPTTAQRPDMSHVLEELKECLAVDQSNTTDSLIMSTRVLSESEVAPCLR